MVRVDICTKETIVRLSKALAKAALGKPIMFIFEEGTHRIVDGEDVFEMPNDTITFRLFVNGGAKETGDPKPVAKETRPGVFVAEKSTSVFGKDDSSV